MAKRTSFIIITLTVLSLITPLHTAHAENSTTIQVAPSTFTVGLGTTFTVNVTVTDVTDLAVWEFRLFYLNTILNCTNITEGPLLKAGGNTFFDSTIRNAYNATHGWLDAGSTLLGQVPGVNGTGTLATITFQTVAAGDTPLQFSHDPLVTFLLDSSPPPRHSISFTTIDGTVHVRSGALVTFSQTGVGSDFAGTVATVDGTNYSVSGLPVSFQWNFGSVHNFTFASPLNVSSGEQEQYFWFSTTGLSTVRNGPLTVTGSGSVTGNFASLRTLTITATVGGTTDPAPGTVTYMNCSRGTVVSVTALPNSGYKLDHWLLDDINVGAVNPIQVLINATHQLQAFFSVSQGWTLNIAVNGSGTTNPSQGAYTYSNGTVVTVTTSSGIGYVFDHWVLDGSNNGTASSTQVLMNTTHQLQAFFKPLNYTLTILATTHGSISPSPGNYSYPYGTVVNVTAVPSTGYGLDHWSLDGSNVGSPNPIQVLITTNHQLTTVFAPFTGNYTLTVTATVGGATSPLPGIHTYLSGTVVTVTASPSTGYYFDHWELDSNIVGATSSTQVSMNSSHQLEAFFASPLAAPAVWITPRTLSFDTVHSHAGDRFNVTVWINTTGPSYAWQVQVNFNASQLNAVRADYTGQDKSLFFTGHETVAVPPTIGNLTGFLTHGESLVGIDQIPAGSTSLFWIEFAIVAAPTGNATLTGLISVDSNPDNTFILDADSKSVPGLGVGSATYSFSSLPRALLGDINGDGRVDLKDVSYVARRFMCTPTDLLWDSVADLNGDGTIDMKDISTVSRHFGEHYP